MANGQAFVNPYNFAFSGGGGGYNGNGWSGNRQYGPNYALQIYDQNMAVIQNVINNDNSLNLISKDQLLTDVSTGRQATQAAAGQTNNADTFDILTQYYINEVQTALNPNAQTTFQQEQAAQDAQAHALPGRSQTILTDRTTTPNGTPTLITGK